MKGNPRGGAPLRRWGRPALLLLAGGAALLLVASRPLPHSAVPAGGGAESVGLDGVGGASRQLSRRRLFNAAEEIEALRRELAQIQEPYHLRGGGETILAQPQPTPQPPDAPPRPVVKVTPKANPDTDPRCHHWASVGECDANRQWMIQHCEESCSRTPPPPPDPPAEERQAMIQQRISELADPEQQCLYVHAVGTHDPGGGGAFRLHHSTQNGKPVWRRVRVPVFGGERWLYADPSGNWVVATSQTEMKRSQGALMSAGPAPFPTDVKQWRSSRQGGWKDAPGVELKRHPLKGCPDRPMVDLPPELIKSLKPEGWQPTKGVDYDADYEIPGPGRDDADFAYGDHPQFRYPGEIKLEGVQKLPHFVLSHKPKVVFFPRFLTDEECDAVIEAGKPRLHRSTVGQDTGKSVSQSRTSWNAWLTDDMPAARMVMERTLAVSGFPAGGHEQLQVLRYNAGQQYQLHHDYMDEGADVLENRALTAFFYLNTVKPNGTEGDCGCTNWPRAGGRAIGNMTACETGLRTFPRKGAAVFFYDARPDGRQDEWTIHAGCPPPAGEVKYGGTYWLHLPREPAFKHVSEEDLAYMSAEQI